MPHVGSIHYRDIGKGEPPIVHLHGGWGYEFYPLDDALAGIARRFVIPDRTGYGRSRPPRRAELPIDFHAMFADETEEFLRAIGIERCVLWGHSDGAIIALLLALETPGQVRGVIAEATHFYRRKPRSQAFFESMIAERPALGDGVTAVLARDHGAGWPQVLARHSRAWHSIAREAASDEEDFYGGRLNTIAVPVLVIHGACDPRTEPGEIEAIGRAVHTVILPAGGHSPHSEPATADDVSRLVRAFIA